MKEGWFSAVQKNTESLQTTAIPPHLCTSINDLKLTQRLNSGLNAFDRLKKKISERKAIGGTLENIFEIVHLRSLIIRG